MPPGLDALCSAPPFEHAEPWLVRTVALTPAEAFDLLGTGAPENILPIAAVDERSFACVVCAPIALSDDASAGLVVRWHLDEVNPTQQLRLLDIGIVDYVISLEDELAAREAGLHRVLDEIGPAYEESYIARDKRPRDFIVRPIRIACQNVIVGLAAIAQDSSFDGLSVLAWQTCEVPHVATHEANRALAALVLCDAFQNGGTMEIRFDRHARVVVGDRTFPYYGHPEDAVPASLRRYARTVGVALGVEDSAAIFPSEARELFLAVTPMPSDLRGRVEGAMATLGLTPERLCFTLMSQTWREIEVDFLLATTGRVKSILEGGQAWQQRMARQCEMDVCRCALMAGMLFRRLNGSDSAGAVDEARVVEDCSNGVTWTIDEDVGAVVFQGVLAGPLPWTNGTSAPPHGVVVAFPRSSVTPEVVDQVRERGGEVTAVLLVPRDTVVDSEIGVPVLRCPDRLADLDLAIEAKLLTSRIARG